MKLPVISIDYHFFMDAMKTCLFKQVKIYELSSPHHLQRCDILLENGRFSRVAKRLEGYEEFEIRELRGVSVSQGWFDLRTCLTVPGFEHKDTLEGIASSARAGGFSDIAVLPNTQPVTQHREGLVAIRQMTRNLPIRFHPMAAASVDTKGLEMTELYDLYKAGGLAFTDGLKPIDNPILIKHLLHYLKGFNGLLINLADTKSLSSRGQMHEGEVSTRLGMKGIPEFVEHLGIQRDLELVRYTGGRLHFACLSTARSVELIRTAKKEGLAVTADVSAAHLFFKDADLADFDPNLKVFPPFRTQKDIDALWKGIEDGSIDAIVSDHHPHDPESKELEFDLADFGMVGLETVFAALMTARPASVSVEKIVSLLANGGKSVLRLPNDQSFREGEKATLTFFSEDEEWLVSTSDIKSHSKNSAFIGRGLKGKVLATYFDSTFQQL